MVLRPIGPEVKSLLLTRGLPFGVVGKGELFHQHESVGRLLGQFAGSEILARTDEGNAVVQSFVDLGTELSVFLGKGVQDGIGGAFSERLLDAVNESIYVHGKLRE